MSKLEELISELCPDGVEYKTLDQIAENHDNERKPITSGNRESGQYPYYGASGIVDYVKDYIFDGDFLLISEDGANLIARNTPIAFSISGKNWVNNHAHILRFDSIITQKFVEHYLESLDLTAFISGAAQPKLNQKNLNKIPIPFPPLPVQNEIVRILGNFTEYIEMLTTELELRKRQSKYYEYELLEFDNNVDYVQIGDCCNVEKGKTPIQKVIPGEYPLVATTENRQSSSTYQFDCSAVCVPLISSRGHGVASISRIYYQEGKFALGNILCAIIPNDKEKLSAEFLRYYLFVKKDTLLVPLMRGGANVALTTDSLKGVKIPIPPIELQLNLIEKLKKFDELENNRLIGLPSEIEARKKQYEYYRDKLLTFKELS